MLQLDQFVLPVSMWNVLVPSKIRTRTRKWGKIREVFVVIEKSGNQKHYQNVRKSWVSQGKLYQKIKIWSFLRGKKCEPCPSFFFSLSYQCS